MVWFSVSADTQVLLFFSLLFLLLLSPTGLLAHSHTDRNSDSSIYQKLTAQQGHVITKWGGTQQQGNQGLYLNCLNGGAVAATHGRARGEILARDKNIWEIITLTLADGRGGHPGQSAGSQGETARRRAGGAVLPSVGELLTAPPFLFLFGQFI